MGDPYGLQRPTPRANLTTGVNTSANEDSQYYWDFEAEGEFKTHREESRARLFNNIKSSSWNEVGLGPFIQVSHKGEMQKASVTI